MQLIFVFISFWVKSIILFCEKSIYFQYGLISVEKSFFYLPFTYNR